MKDYMEGFINRVNGLHNSIANDVWPNGLLNTIANDAWPNGWDRQCKKCGKVTHMTQEECAYALAHGWPKCCGEEMGDIAQKEAK